MSKIPKLGPNAALAELLARDGELDRILSGHGLSFYKPTGSDGVPPPVFHIPPADWAEEERQRKAAEREKERAERAEILAEELERLAREDEERHPAKKRPRILQLLNPGQEATP